MGMFRKVLIANRGEIAVRIMQTCRELGISTVAVYSDADVAALHVRLADSAFAIGPAPATQSYLCAEKIVKTALESGADAVHPGYGFLAENAHFARQVAAAGLVWIGPSPEVIALMGDKMAAKEMARSAGVPVVPGYYGDNQSAERMLREAQELGFPVMLKAAAGGGGRGMREVHHPDELVEALASARREAGSAFGDDRVFLEQLVRHPRHIEVQIIADSHGNAVYLGERDCSVQRRHQKVVEEAPSPAVTPDFRRSMGQDAVRLVRASGYNNAGTIEYLFSDDRYYFLEMNTRIQVEHPVTEAVTGFDLVRLQIEIAAGKTIDIFQPDVRVDGHAIEARIYAEDADHDFLPSNGTVYPFHPPTGVGIRNDVGVAEGVEVSQYYDSMLAKLTVHASSRSDAITRLRLALERYDVGGLTTNRAFLLWILQQDEFLRGRASTDFVDRLWTAPPALSLPPEALAAAAGFELLHPAPVRVTEKSGETGNAWLGRSHWRGFGMSTSLDFEFQGVAHQVRVDREPGSVVVRTMVGVESRFWLDSVAHPRMLLGPDGQVIPLEVVRRVDGLDVSWGGSTFRLTYPSGDGSTRSGIENGDGGGNLAAPMPGTVIRVAVEEGQQVSRFQPLVVLEAMKMEHVIQAPHDGIVRTIYFAPGDLVPAGAALVRLESE